MVIETWPKSLEGATAWGPGPAPLPLGPPLLLLLLLEERSGEAERVEREGEAGVGWRRVRAMSEGMWALKLLL